MLSLSAAHGNAVAVSPRYVKKREKDDNFLWKFTLFQSLEVKQQNTSKSTKRHEWLLRHKFGLIEPIMLWSREFMSHCYDKVKTTFLLCSVARKLLKQKSISLSHTDMSSFFCCVNFANFVNLEVLRIHGFLLVLSTHNTTKNVFVCKQTLWETFSQIVRIWGTFDFLHLISSAVRFFARNSRDYSIEN